MTGLPLPKPQPRGRKPKKPISRRTRPAKVRKGKAAAEKRAKDREWADKIVRASSGCVISRLSMLTLDPLGWTMFPGDGQIHIHTITRCREDIQDAAHLVSRRYKATRHDPDNGFRLCRRSHDWFTRHPIEWEKFVRTVIGDEKFEALRRKALAGSKAEQ